MPHRHQPHSDRHSLPGLPTLLRPERLAVWPTNTPLQQSVLRLVENPQNIVSCCRETASVCEITREKYTKEIIFDDKINVNEQLKLYLTVDGWLTQLFPKINVCCVVGF